MSPHEGERAPERERAARGRTLEGDRALLDAFRRGERAALETVFDLYVDDVALTVRAGVVVQVDGQAVRVGTRIPEPEVEVLVQETFARAFAPRAREGYDGVRPYGPYLGTIARNLVIDRGRELQRQAKNVSDVEVERVAADGAASDPAWHLEEAELARVLSAFMSDLEEPEKSIYRLRYEEQKSHRETARELSMTEIQIRRRDTRLRARLLEYLRERGFLRDAKVAIGSSLLGRRGG